MQIAKIPHCEGILELENVIRKIELYFFLAFVKNIKISVTIKKFLQ